MNIVSSLLPFIAVLGAMIFVHEFGHFAVAKFFKVKVEIFSLGFGPRLFGFRLGDTDYRISAIPLGGYVKMKGENLDEELDFAGDEFLAKPKWQRLLVLFAGPFMNIVTAIAIPAIMAMIIFQMPLYKTQTPIVGSVAQGSAAAAAGIKPGDKIIKVDSKENPDWHDVEVKGDISPNIPIQLVIERNGEKINTTLTPKVHKMEGEPVGLTGLLPTYKDEPAVVVEEVMDGGPAKQADLRANDKIVALNGEPVKNFPWLQYSLQNLDDQDVTVTVERNNEKVDLKVRPHRDADGRVRVGFAPKRESVPSEPMITARLSFMEAMRMSLKKNYEILIMTKEALGQIFTGQRKAGDALSGPISIAAISGKVYKSGGVQSLLDLMALLSLNLGIFNLFPIPVLDGGHIFIIILEGLLGLGGYKLSLNIKEKMLQAGFVMLVLLMGFVIINDISKFFTSRDTPAAKTNTQQQPAQPAQPTQPVQPAQPAPAK